jgi:hypothetical protein
LLVGRIDEWAGFEFSPDSLTTLALRTALALERSPASAYIAAPE